MRARFAVLSVLVLLGAGCITATDEPETPGATATAGRVTSVFERATLPFNTSGEWSTVLDAGALAILDVQSVFVDVSLPLEELGSAADGSARVHMGLWLPDVPTGTKVPVIADVGPYYNDGDTPATVPADRLGRFLIENYVPHGYAVAQVSVFGSGDSTHCMDLMGAAEQAGIDAAVTWLGAQEWSNGNVGLIGRSYDGSTPWEAAMFGNPALKTIVPISGLVGMYELMWRNGSAESRGAIMHNVVYGTFGVDQDPEDVYNLCTDYLLGPAHGVGAVVTGDHFGSPASSYWDEREFLPRALASYQGSVYFIHGLQDWNVDPHMIAPAYQMLQAAGIETKGLFGQWAHMYPDRASEHENLPPGRGNESYPMSVRMDWAQDLLEWFDHYLKGTGDKPSLHVEVQDNLGGWRVETSFPPLDAAWADLALSAAEKRHTGQDAVTPTSELEFAYAPLSEDMDVRISGLPQFHVTVTPTGPGGQLYAMLSDAETGMHLGHAIMDLRYAAGGREMQPVVAGQPLVALMEFEPLDVVVPAGHGLILTLSATGDDYVPSATTNPVLVDTGDASVLRLPIVERGDDAFFVPPGPSGPVVGDTPKV